MRILLLHNYYQQSGGEDAVFEAEASLLASKGHAVETLLFDNKQIQSKLDQLQTGLFSFHNPRSATSLKQKIKAFQPDIIHIHNFFPIGSPSLLREAKQQNIPVIMTLHNFRLICSNALLLRNGIACESCIKKVLPLDGMRHACYRNSKVQTALLTAMTAYHKIAGSWRNQVHRYIALNRFSRDKFLGSSLNLTEQQVVVKPNFIFDPGYSDSVKEDYFLFVGRLSEEKGIETLLEAFKNSPIQLQIIGSGPLEKKVHTAVKESSNIKYLGFQNRDFVLDRLRTAKALILPSLVYENFPISIIEAFATGTPVITSDHGGLPYIVQENENGLLVEAGSPFELRKKVHQLLSDSKNHRKMCQNARKSYETLYTPERNYQMLIDIYSEALQ